jgi:hypothetical protein
MMRPVSRPGYANITATLALVVALGGTGYAAVSLPKHSVGSKQLKKDAVVSKKVKNNSLTGSDIDEATLGTIPDAATLEGRSLRGISQWVLVNEAGSAIQQSGGITAVRLTMSSGRYRVSFPNDVSACGLNANATTETSASDSSPLRDTRVVVARSTTSGRDVQVQLWDHDGFGNPQAFFLTAQC